MTEHTLICSESGVRLDKFIADADIGVSRSAAVGLIESGGVSLNGERANKKQKLKTGDEIKVCIPDPVPYEAKAENIPLEIILKTLP